MKRFWAPPASVLSTTNSAINTLVQPTHTSQTSQAQNRFSSPNRQHNSLQSSPMGTWIEKSENKSCSPLKQNAAAFCLYILAGKGGTLELAGLASSGRGGVPLVGACCAPGQCVILISQESRLAGGSTQHAIKFTSTCTPCTCVQCITGKLWVSPPHVNNGSSDSSHH